MKKIKIIFIFVISQLLIHGSFANAQDISTQGVLAVYERAKAMASVAKNQDANTTENYMLAAEFRGMVLGTYYAYSNASQAAGNKPSVCVGNATTTDVAKRVALFITEAGGDKLLSSGPSMMMHAPLRFLYPCKE